MKIRNSFVSNSSSASFIIPKVHLTEIQISLIKNHISEGLKFGMEYCNSYDEWKIIEDNENIYGDTYMDNFEMKTYLKRIGVDMSKVKFEDDLLLI